MLNHYIQLDGLENITKKIGSSLSGARKRLRNIAANWL
jgi:hypothetical protein